MKRKWLWITLFLVGMLMLSGVGLLQHFDSVTHHAYYKLVRDPPRHSPLGSVFVAPADGIVLYTKRIERGSIPEMIKKGVSVPVTAHLRGKPQTAAETFSGWLVGIYMPTNGVHINRVALTGKLIHQQVYNGPHLNMTSMEIKIVLGALVPGWITLRKLLGLSPYDITEDGDYILHSSREVLSFKDVRGKHHYLIRIADYWVGRILTWVQHPASVVTGQRLGMIAWGSQTDLLIEDSPGLAITVTEGDLVFAGESVVASYDN